MVNDKVRVSMLRHNCPQWKLARALGISESTLTRKLREELPEADQDELVELIEGGLSDET